MIVRNRYVLPIRVTDKDAFLSFVHSCYFPQDHRGVLLVPKDAADWSRNLTRRQRGRRHLVQQRLKQVVVGTVYQDDFRRCASKCLGGGQSPKTPTDDDDSRLRHAYLDSLLFG